MDTGTEAEFRVLNPVIGKGEPCCAIVEAIDGVYRLLDESYYIESLKL